MEALDDDNNNKPNHNTTTLCLIGLSLLSSVSKHTMWSYYDWVYCCCRPSVNMIYGRIIIGLNIRFRLGFGLGSAKVEVLLNTIRFYLQ